jgi:hypothetical protein
VDDDGGGASASRYRLNTTATVLKHRPEKAMELASSAFNVT